MKATTMALALLALSGSKAAAEDLQTYTLVVKGHKFSPAELHVPAGKPFYLIVSNKDDTADEFEMSAPPLEKVVQPGDEGRIRVRPLAPGKFGYFDDFHPEAKGTLVAD
jgi:uncharacterized cupredoxin-like copper-binding protein